LSIAELAASVCYDSEPTENYRIAKGCKATNHVSVLEHISFTFCVTGVSRALLAQLSRHRHISLSVQSQRYVAMNNFDYVNPFSDEDADVFKDILLCVDDDMRMEALRQTNYVKSIVTAQGKMDLERKGKQSYQGWMFARLLAFSNGDLQALYDRSDGFYRRQLVLTTKEKPAGRMDDPDLAQKMKAEVEGIFLWAFEGLQRLVANNFKFTESERTKTNRESVKRDNNNIFDFMESEGYIRLKADASISSKELYEIYRMWCEENSLPPLKSRSFSDSVVANLSRYNLEHTNKITNSAGRRVWGFMGIEAVARPNINGFYDVSPCTYVPEEWRD